MREIRPSGSVRGVRSNPYPYRDPKILPARSAALSSTLRNTSWPQILDAWYQPHAVTFFTRCGLS